MSFIHLTLKHGRTLEEARTLLEQTVDQARSQFGLLVQRVEWSADRNCVQLAGTGFDIKMSVDAHEVHVEGDIPILGRLLAGPLVTGLKGILQRTFHKQLTGEPRK